MLTRKEYLHRCVLLRADLDLLHSISAKYAVDHRNWVVASIALHSFTIFCLTYVIFGILMLGIAIQ